VKLRDSLNPHHEDGKSKARVFKSVLGVSRDDAEWLANASWKQPPPGLSGTDRICSRQQTNARANWHGGRASRTRRGRALLVEFSDEQGEIYAMIPVRPEQLLVLHRDTEAA
jgi:alpha-glucuronidase